MISRSVIVPDPRHVRRRIVGIDRALRTFGARSRVVPAKDRISRRSDRSRVCWRSRDGAVKGSHVEVGGTVVGEPEPAADAFRPGTFRHLGGNVERGHFLLDAFVLDAEDGEVVHRHVVDVVDVGDRERAARNEVPVDDLGVGVARLQDT